MQLDIFGGTSNEVLLTQRDKKKSGSAPAIWSFSRLDTMKQCPRKYYYQYFGSKKSRAKNDLNKERLIFLSGLQNKHLIIGDIIHHIIKSYFKKAIEGEVWDSKRLINWGNKWFSDSITASEQYVKLDSLYTAQTRPPILLKEIIFNEEQSSQLAKEGTEKITECLENFRNSTVFQDVRVGGTMSSAYWEKKIQFEFNNVKVTGVVDLIFSDSGNMIITDWKTGKYDIEETSLQLLTYAWWAIKKQQIPMNNIVIQKAYLYVNKLDTFDYSEYHLERAKARIIQDIELLGHYDCFGDGGLYHFFSKINQDKICDLCQFKSVCKQSD